MNAFKLIVLTLLIAAFANTAVAQTVPVFIDEVELDDTVLNVLGDNRLSLERGEEYEVRVRLTPFADVRDAEVRVFISGYEFSDVDDIEDKTQVFDADENVTYVKKLNIRIPDDLDRDDYQLRVIVSDRNSDSLSQSYNLKIDAPRNAVRIDDVIFNPSSAVRAGSSLLTKVRIENVGERDQDDVRVTVNIPGLGVTGTAYIEELDNGDDEEETEEIFIRIPKCAAAGTYDVFVEAEFQKRHNKVTSKNHITVLEDDTCNQDEKVTSITLGNQLQNVIAGQTVVFPITVTNAAKTSKTFTVSVPAQEWAAITITPTSTLVVPAGQTSTVFVNVQVHEEALAGAHALVATVTSGKDSVSQLTMTANVTAAPTKIADVLQAVLIILVVLLVLLGIILGVSHARNKEKTEAYY